MNNNHKKYVGTIIVIEMEIENHYLIRIVAYYIIIHIII